MLMGRWKILANSDNTLKTESGKRYCGTQQNRMVCLRLSVSITNILFSRIPWTHLLSDKSELAEEPLDPWMTDHHLHPITGRSPRPTEDWAFRPIVAIESTHVPVSRQKRFRAKPARSLFRCRSAGTITTVTGDNGVQMALLYMDCAWCE